MNSYETLSNKELENVEKNLLKQIDKVRNERKSRVKDLDQQPTSSLSSVFKISLFSGKTEDKKEVKENKAKEVKVKVKVEKEDKKEKKEVKEKKSSDDDKPRPIKATISSMKEVLDYHHIDYPSNAKKDDFAKLLRENNLVREAEKKESNKKDK
jgi:hypothetical protein